MRKVFFLLLIFITGITGFSNIQITLPNIALKEALKALEEISGSTILTSPDIKGTIHTTINAINLENALDSLLYSTNYEYKKISEDLYLVGNFNIKMQNMQKEILQMEFNNLDLKKILNLLTLLSEKVFVIQNLNIILLNKNDEMHEYIKALFEFLETQDKSNDYFLFFSIYEISDNVYQFLKENEKVEYEKTFFIKNKKSTIILENNFEYLTRIKELEYHQLKMPSSQEITYYKTLTNNNIVLDFSNNKLLIKHLIMKENNSILLNTNEIGYLAIENEGKYYILAITYLNLSDIYIKKNHENIDNSESLFNFGIGYLIPDAKFIVISGINLGNNYIEISSNFKEHLDFSLSTNLVNNMNLGVLFKKNSKESNTNIFVNDLQHYDNFDLYGNIILGGTVSFSNTLTNSLDYISYDLLVLKDIIKSENNSHIVTFAPGVGIKVSRNDKLKPYINFGVQYKYKLLKSKISLLYYYQMNIHKMTCSLEF